MVEKRLWKYPQEKVPKVESSRCQNKFLLAHFTKGVSPSPLSPPFLHQEQESFGLGILSCSVEREKQSEVEEESDLHRVPFLLLIRHDFGTLPKLSDQFFSFVK